MEAFKPSLEEIQNFAIAVIVVTVGLVTFYGEYTVYSMLLLFLTALAALFARETGQRLVGQLLNARVTLELSKVGAIVSLGAALIAYIGNTPAVFLLPIYSEFAAERYNQWGYEIPVVWSKREYWFAATGMVFVLSLALAAFMVESYVVSRSLALFAFFQLIPLKETSLSESTDGAYILLQSGFVWLTLLAASILGIVFPL
jgi:hypothetical protein